MVGTYTMTTETDVTTKLGAGVSAGYTDAMKTAAAVRKEALLNVFVTNNFSDTYAALNADVKGIISDIVSSEIAIEGIQFDTKGYITPQEAADKVNTLRDSKNQAMSILREKNSQDFITNA